MRLLHPNGNFWSGSLGSRDAFTRWSTGLKVQQRTTTFKSVAAAKKTFAAVIKKLEGMGYRREFPTALLAALQDNPRDEGSLAVLADLFQGTGDVRGELAALVLARKEDELAAFLEREASALFGPALDDVEAGHLLDLSWTPGFLFGVTIDSESPEPTPLRELITRLAGAPVAPLLRSVTLAPAGDLWSEGVAELAHLPHPEVLSSLHLDASALDLTRDEFDAGDFSSSWQYFPALRDLRLAGTSMVMGALPLPELECFSRIGGGIPVDDLDHVAGLPKLERLELGFELRDYEGPALPSERMVKSMARLFKRPLRHLALRHLELTPQLLAALFESTAFSALRGLDLGDCVVDEEAREYLLDEAKALGRLASVSSPCSFPDEDDEEVDEDDEKPRGDPVLRGRNVVEDAWSLATARDD
jgi:hypothetical protein